jgi:hypothetical protein
MDNEDAELDRLQSAYKSAVDTWVATIRAEEALSSGDHNLAQVDKWEAAHFVAEGPGARRTPRRPLTKGQFGRNSSAWTECLFVDVRRSCPRRRGALGAGREWR